MFVIKNLTSRKYVAERGSKSSFTPMLQRARTFADRASAEAEACGDEIVLHIQDAMGG